MRRVREQVAQVAFVEVRMIEAVVLAFLAVVLTERLLQPGQRLRPRRFDFTAAAGAPARASAGPCIRACAAPATAYRVNPHRPGSSHTGESFAKSSSG